MTKKEFDEIIKNNLVTIYSKEAFGYKVPAGKEYELYYSMEMFDAFKEEMCTLHPLVYDHYKKGKGNELVEQTVGGIIRPPKMASVASSSRFAYIALSNDNVIFEKGCPITGINGIPPQLDAYLRKDNIYFEVKCHEIFDEHRLLLSKQYWKYIYGMENDFGFEKKEEIKEKQFHITTSDFGIDNNIKMKFDLKQFLCHLLGIKSQGNDKSALVYLFFKPKVNDLEEQAAIDLLFSELTDEITNIFNSRPIKVFTEKNNISIYAIAENSYIMEPITDNNYIRLY